jgi:Fe-S-cluster containining protein
MHDRAEAHPEALAELGRVYEALDAELLATGAICRASGNCCNFPEYGHTLFATGLEAEYVRAHVPSEKFRWASEELCPFWVDRKCTIREHRALGCRSYFCDREKTEALQAIHEKYLERIRGIERAHGIAPRYAPLIRIMAEWPESAPPANTTRE